MIGDVPRVHLVGGEVPWHRTLGPVWLAPPGTLHAERPIDVRGHQVGHRRATGPLDRHLQHAVPEVRVAPQSTHRKHRPGEQAHRIEHRHRSALVVVEEPVMHPEPRRVRSDVAHGDSATGQPCWRYLGHQGSDRGVEREPARIDERAEHGGGDRLGGRRQAERRLGARRAVGLGQHHTGVGVGHTERRRGQRPVGHRRAQHGRTSPGRVEQLGHGALGPCSSSRVRCRCAISRSTGSSRSSPAVSTARRSR